MRSFTTRHLLAPLLTALVALLAGAGAARADALDPPALAQPAASATVTANPEFTWTAVPRAAKYRIQVSTSAAFASVAWTADVYGPTATPTTELPLGTLYWRVASIDASSTPGTYSAASSFTKTQAPAPVLTGPASAVTLGFPAQGPVLSWQPVAGMKSYTVQVDDESTFTGATSYSTSSTSLALPTALPSNSARYWRVQGVATNTAVTTAWSDTGDLRTFSIAWAAGSVPTLLTPADSLVDNIDEPVFTWTPVAGAAQYEFQLATNVGFTANVTTQLTDATRYAPLNALTQDQYYWRVRAVANGDPAGWSAVRGFKREWLDGTVQARPAITINDTDPLTAGTQVESNNLVVSWTAVPRASYYEVDISTESSFNTPAADNSFIHRTCQTAHTSWTPYLTGSYTANTIFAGGCAWVPTPTSSPQTRFILPGATYYVRVRAVDETPSGAVRTTLWSNGAREGEGAPPDTTTFELVTPTTATTSASLPAVPISSPDSADTPMLTWQPVTGAVAYLVAISRDSSFNSRVLDHSVATTNTSLRLDQVLQDNSTGQPYFWFAIPCTSWTNSTTYTCSVGENLAINNPTYSWSFNKLGKAVEGLTAAPTQTDTVALSWQDQLTTSPGGGGIKHYEVEVRNASDAVVASVKTDALSYTPINTTWADGAYSWRVRAYDASNTPLAWSSSGSFAKQSSVPVPSAPAAGDALPTLKWSATSFAGSYDVEVFRGTDAAFPASSKVGTASAADLPYPVYTPSAALPAGTYSWRVRQQDATGKAGPWSTQMLPFTVGGTKPAPSAPADTAGVPVTGLVYRWDPVPGAVRYRLESSTGPGFATTADSVVTSATAYAPTTPHTGGTTYYWRVSALDAADNILATSDARAYTAQTTPAAPTASAAVSGKSLAVSWNPSATGGSPITGYVLRYRPTGTTTWTEQTYAGDVNSAGLGDVPAGQKYDAQVAAINAVGTGPFSTLVTATAPTVPTAPGGLKLTARPGGFTVSWTKPADGGAAISGYVVRVTPAAGGTTTETSVSTSPATLGGLAQAAGYTVEVAAENVVGRSAFASAQGTTGTVVSTASTVTLTGPKAIRYGSRAALGGTLLSKAGTPIAAANVVIESRRSSTATWGSPTPVTTAADGKFTAALLLRAGTQFRAVFAGVAPNLAATSPTLTVLVAPRIALRSTTLAGRRGRTVRLTGHLLPKSAGKTVTLACLQAKRWVSRGSGRTSSSGAFSVPLKLTTRGLQTCQVVTAADTQSAAGRSARVKIRAR